MKANCNSTVTNTFHSGNGVAVRVRSRTVQVSSQNGVSLSCDLSQELCSFTLDGLLHGGQKNKQLDVDQQGLQTCSAVLICEHLWGGGFYTGASAGLLGTNDNEAGNDSPLPDRSQAQNLDSFFNSWQVGQVRIKP